MFQINIVERKRIAVIFILHRDNLEGSHKGQFSIFEIKRIYKPIFFISESRCVVFLNNNYYYLESSIGFFSALRINLLFELVLINVNYIF